MTELRINGRAMLLACVFGASSLAALGGCAARALAPETYANATADQRYELDEVKRRLQYLQVGMDKPHVLVTLGSPAIQENSKWTYLPERSGAILPASRLEVLFDARGRYSGHKESPIIFSKEGPE